MRSISTRADAHEAIGNPRNGPGWAFVNMNHPEDRLIVEAAEHSERRIVVSHIHPSGWQIARRNIGDAVIQVVTGNGDILGLSLCPYHLKDTRDR